jgi:hypothetical protein
MLRRSGAVPETDERIELPREIRPALGRLCRRHTGISRVHADRIIRQYEEFGKTCFRQSSLARISPEGYREIAGAVEDNCIEIDRRQAPIDSCAPTRP